MASLSPENSITLEASDVLAEHLLDSNTGDLGSNAGDLGANTGDLEQTQANNSKAY